MNASRFGIMAILTALAMLTFSTAIAASEKFSGLIIRTTGKAQVEKSGKKTKAKRNMIVEAGDIDGRLDA